MQHSALVELFRWGYAQVPGIVFHYAKELDLDVEDIGVLSTIFYTLERTKPLFQTGIQVGQILQACPFLSKTKLSRRLARLSRMEILNIEGSNGFTEKSIALEPLLVKLEGFLVRDHKHNFYDDPFLFTVQSASQNHESHTKKDVALKVVSSETAEIKAVSNVKENFNQSKDYKKLADFIAKRTGNLLSFKMSAELKKWLEEIEMAPEFLFCVLELCFERNLHNPREITRITKDLKEYSITTVEGLESYFSRFVDGQNNLAKSAVFDPEIMEFGSYTGIDMNAEARKTVYYKWRYDWGFSHAMIMKAGEIMCQHTRNGGLEYIDSILYNWLVKEIRQPEQADAEIKTYKSRQKSKSADIRKTKTENKPEYELFTPPLSNK